MFCAPHSAQSVHAIFCVHHASQKHAFTTARVLFVTGKAWQIMTSNHQSICSAEPHHLPDAVLIRHTILSEGMRNQPMEASFMWMIRD